VIKVVFVKILGKEASDHQTKSLAFFADMMHMFLGFLSLLH
jgi:hypothetical protein